MRAFVGLLSMLMFVVSCSTSTTAKLTKQETSTSNRIVYGKIIDLNPESIPKELRITYTLSEVRQNNIMASFDQYPRLEPDSNYFWITVPKDTTYFGVNSIRFKLNGVDGEAVIRDDKNHAPLLGVQFQPGTTPVYIGDITIRSGLRKYSVGLEVEGFDLKEAYIKNNAAIAKQFLEKNGIDTNEVVISPLSLKKNYQASLKSTKTTKRK